jgi:hypothetical protein
MPNMIRDTGRPVLEGNNNRMMSLFQHPPTGIGAKVEHPVSQGLLFSTTGRIGIIHQIESP